MRVDKFLNSVNITKRRAVSEDMCKNGVVSINGVVVKPAKDVKVGDIITFYCEKTKCKTKIIALRKYSLIKSMLKNEEINKLLPNHSFNEAYNVYKKIYPNFKVREFGLLVIEVEKF